ncbi:MAG: porin [Proteobacteria bacterium]|nr:porin [Pseudomonadota bacterium]
MTPFTKKINLKLLTRIDISSSIKVACTAAAIATAPITASAYSFKDSSGNVDFTVGGYAKLSAIYSDTDSGKITNELGRNIYLPSATPVGAGDSHQVLDLTARESRINFKAKTEQGGHKMGMVLEMDFLGTTNGNEVVSNSYSPRMRHFFFTFDNWLFGQTWSTFMDTGALAEAVDFLASPEGIVFIRQAQVRYSSGDFQVALENPESFVSGSNDRDVNTLPDLTANYKLKGGWGHMRLNGLLRLIEVDDPGVQESEAGYGVGVSGKIKVGSTDDIRFSANYGDGMGRYTSLGLVKDGILINGKIETVKSVAATAAYHHAWNAKSRSNLIFSMADIDNPTGAAGTENKSSSSIQINYLYSPVKQVSYGIMYLAGERETENGDDGKLSRIQATAKYSF